MKFQIDPASYLKQIFEDPNAPDLTYGQGRETLLSLSEQDKIFLETQIKKNIKNIERRNALLSIVHEEDAFNNFQRYKGGWRNTDLIVYIKNECGRGKDTYAQDFIAREFSAFNFMEGDLLKVESEVFSLTGSYISNHQMLKVSTEGLETTLKRYKEYPVNDLKSSIFQSEKKNVLVEKRKGKINSEKQYTGKSFMEAAKENPKSKEFEKYDARIKNKEARNV